jgi:hypothetical protein
MPGKQISYTETCCTVAQAGTSAMVVITLNFGGEHEDANDFDWSPGGYCAHGGACGASTDAGGAEALVRH